MAFADKDFRKQKHERLGECSLGRHPLLELSRRHVSSVDLNPLVKSWGRLLPHPPSGPQGTASIERAMMVSRLSPIIFLQASPGARQESGNREIPEPIEVALKTWQREAEKNSSGFFKRQDIRDDQGGRSAETSLPKQDAAADEFAKRILEAGLSTFPA